VNQDVDKIPVVSRWVRPYEARLKKAYCLFLLRLGLLKPMTFVQWLATYECPLSCHFCEASAGSKAADELATSEVFGLLDDLAGMGIKRFLVSGGEPLQRPDILQILPYAGKLGLSLGLVSNGYFVEEKWQELQKLHYFLYFTSIDGPRDYHDQARGMTHAYDRAMQALKLFTQIHVPVRIVNSVIMPENLELLEELRPCIENSGASHWHLTPASPVGRAANQERYRLKGTQLRKLLEFIRRNQGNRRLVIALGESHGYLQNFCGQQLGRAHFCGAGLTRCAIMPNGDVMGCQQVYDASYAEGNIRLQRFSHIWKNGFQRFRQNRIDPACMDCRFVNQCRGGCWAEKEKQGQCLKGIWEADEPLSC
jgi:radical SAM protein with 4Fe4S-binding SPASM domain